jgi:uncharacterized protein involved in exopolysaccharide biosynthesis
VRVYQETVANLVRTNADIAGLNALENEQKTALKNIDDQLTAMAEREAELEALRTTVVQSQANVEAFSKRAFEEQLAQDLNEHKFSPVQILQEATRPLKPIWPKPALLLALGAALCVMPWLVMFGLYYAIVSERIANDWPAQRDPTARVVPLEYEDFVKETRTLGTTASQIQRKGRKARRRNRG